MSMLDTGFAFMFDPEIYILQTMSYFVMVAVCIVWMDTLITYKII